jgi:hypothetical protein
MSALSQFSVLRSWFSVFDYEMVMLTADRVLLISMLRPWPVGIVGRGAIHFLLRANQNVRAKGRAVNSVFLVQLRKCLPGIFLDGDGSGTFFDDAAVMRVEGLSWDCGNRLGEKFWRTERLIVHRGYTGNAERQWSVAGGQSWYSRCEGCEGRTP